ncbi:MAG: hypothetical protein KDK90_07065 [Leptospiraceae bacterium]|nr:hypothetical protein [Leptospiraceae bacterium]
MKIFSHLLLLTLLLFVMSLGADTKPVRIWLKVISPVDVEVLLDNKPILRVDNSSGKNKAYRLIKTNLEASLDFIGRGFSFKRTIRDFFPKQREDDKSRFKTIDITIRIGTDKQADLILNESQVAPASENLGKEELEKKSEKTKQESSFITLDKLKAIHNAQKKAWEEKDYRKVAKLGIDSTSAMKGIEEPDGVTLNEKQKLMLDITFFIIMAGSEMIDEKKFEELKTREHSHPFETFLSSMILLLKNDHESFLNFSMNALNLAIAVEDKKEKIILSQVTPYFFHQLLERVEDKIYVYTILWLLYKTTDSKETEGVVSKLNNTVDIDGAISKITNPKPRLMYIIGAYYSGIKNRELSGKYLDMAYQSESSWLEKAKSDKDYEFYFKDKK